MSWVTPITDRALSDIINRTSKAFMNIADWVRINGNTAEAAALVETLIGYAADLDTLTEPVITHFPTADEINALIANINAVRLAACLPIATGVIDLKDDYEPGNGTAAPGYTDANNWERDLLLIYTLLPIATSYQVYCGVANAGQPRFYQHRWRG